MKVRVFRSGKGDCLLITSDTGRHILVDGGVPETYKEHWVNYVARMRKRDEVIDLVCVSHIDRDHIGGILKMLDNEMQWRLQDIREALPDHLKPRKKRATKKLMARPPEINKIWHNGFFEKVRTNFINNNNAENSSDIEDVLFRLAGIYAGAQNTDIPLSTTASVNSQRIANSMQFWGQSVGDAIQVSRRISADQLNIPLNPEYDGGFVLRQETPFTIADMQLRVLGPTAAELRELVKGWNEWLVDKASYLKKLQKKHDRDADSLQPENENDIFVAAQQNAIALASNQVVTPPNLASIVLHIEDDKESILLTGDADDQSILDGLAAAGLLGDEPFYVDVLKVPHHGAHNSYSDQFARSVRAKHYVFCGNGEHHNPEIDVLEGYLTVLLKGKDGHPPVLPAGEKIKFWFNCGPELVVDERKKIRDYWQNVETLMEKWDNDFSQFRYKFMRSGDSFRI